MDNVFDHIAIAVPRIADAAEFLVGELGGRTGHGGPSAEFRWFHWDYAGGGRIEVLEPDGTSGGFVARFLERRGAGLHHVTFQVADLDAMCKRARACGYGIVGYNASDPGWREAFLHPKQAMGIVVQMAEVGERRDGAARRRLEPPAEPASPPPAVRVRGLRMRTGDAERARQQWGELLGGALAEQADELIFSWPRKGMRVAVTVEPGATDEAVAIELSAERRLELPLGPHPRLGARFVAVGD